MPMEPGDEFELDGESFTIESVSEDGELTLVDGGGKKKKHKPKMTSTFQPKDFVSNGDFKGRVERVDGVQALITVYDQNKTGWVPGLRKVLADVSQLTRIGELPPPQNASKHLKVVNKTADSAELIIYSDIGSGFFFGGFSAEDFDNELKALGDIRNLSVRINSPGGDVFDGITIYNRLKAHPANTTVYVDGLAASIASIIAMAADEVVVFGSSTVMIHKPWTMTGGDATELRSTAERLDLVESQMLDIYARKTGLDTNTLRDMLAEETWMDGARALELGFADTLDGGDTALAAHTSIERQWLHRPESFKAKRTSCSQSREERLKALGLIK